MSPPPRQWWQRRIVDPIVAQLTQGLTPHQIALTIAIGSALAMFPIFGTTTLLCLLAGVFMRLNQPIIQAVNLVCGPIHLPFIFFAFKWGDDYFTHAHPQMEFTPMMRLFREDPIRFVHDYQQAALYAIVVWAILVPFWSGAIYAIARPILQGIDRVRIDTTARAAAEKARTHPVP